MATNGKASLTLLPSFFKLFGRLGPLSYQTSLNFVLIFLQEELEKVVAETLPFLLFQTYTFDESSVKSRISHAVRHALEVLIRFVPASLCSSLMDVILPRCFCKRVTCMTSFFPFCFWQASILRVDIFDKYTPAICGLV